MRPKYFEIAVPTTGGAYSAGNCVGGLLAIPYPTGFDQWVLKNIYVVDQANQGAELFLNFFRSKPAGTFTDQAGITFTAADSLLLVASVEVLAANYKTSGTMAIADTAYSIGGFTVCPTDGTPPLMYVVMTTSGTPTYGAGSGATSKLRLAGSVLVDQR